MDEVNKQNERFTMNVTLSIKSSTRRHTGKSARCPYAKILASLLLAVLCCGCYWPKVNSIKGTVVTHDGLAQSFIGGMSTVPAKEDVPVEGVRVLLAFDKDGEQPVKGCEAVTDSKGSYVINTKDIPRKPQYGDDYYLIATKDGFESLSRAVGLGPFSKYTENVIELKRNK